MKRIVLSVTAAVAVACGQGDPVFPGEGAPAQCGDWYPGAGADAGAAEYAIEVGATFPCLAWESARASHQDTYFNAGELYLAAKHGATTASALVVVLVGASCAGCQELVGALAEHRDELAGAFMVGAVRDDWVEETTLDRAEEVLVDQDGWPADWLVTNDAEGHLSADEFSGVPWVFVVRLSDMAVAAGGLGVYTDANVDDLVAFVAGLGDGAGQEGP
jgi:hypothetical protein